MAAPPPPPPPPPFSCTAQFLLYPSLFLILLVSSLNHHYRFIKYPSSPSCTNITNTNTIIFSNNNNNTINSHNVSSSFTLINDHIPNSTTTNTSMVKKKDRVEVMEEGLARARAAIRQAGRSRSYTSNKVETFVPRGCVYINPYAFHQSHIEMERRFKVWAYKEGEEPLFHKGPVNNIYSIEGQFIDEFDSDTGRFAASDPDEAMAFFLPVSIVNIIRFVYRPYTNYSRDRLQNVVKDYIDLLSNRYGYWNRSSGADHFLVSCHDWAPDVSAAHPDLYKHFIRVLCNANSTEGFRPNRDVSLPEIFLDYGELGPPDLAEPPDKRNIFAFFSGGSHGDVRKLLFEHWKDKQDEEIRVYKYLPKTLNYTELMSRSKYCLCPSGWEVASPRLVESIHAGCVPVIVSDAYVLPFSDVLDWSKFSVHIPVRRIPEIKTILKGISDEEYLKKQGRVVEVQRHFKLNRPSEAYDMMDMVIHSVWLRRLNFRLEF